VRSGRVTLRLAEVSLDASGKITDTGTATATTTRGAPARTAIHVPPGVLIGCTGAQTQPV
jgi:hypothetical protein